MLSPKKTYPLAALAVTLAACATAPSSGEPLPFHVAVGLGVESSGQEPTFEEGSAAEIELAFAAEEVSRSLVEALEGSFQAVTALSPPRESEVEPEAWIREAEAAGADLIVQVLLRYHPKLHTALNDRFWLNLPLFALGGPGTWFVADRSYYFQASLDAEVFDVSAAAAPQVRVLEADARLLQINRPLERAALNFLDRASGADSWVLSVIMPSGFLAAGSSEAKEQLQQVIARELCVALARGLQERNRDLVRSLVDFYPEDVRVDEQDEGRHLVGDFVLQMGRASELGTFRYRYGQGEYLDAQWGESTVQSSGLPGQRLRRYAFRIPLVDAGDAATVQLEVEQLDADASKRTFTFPVQKRGGSRDER